MTHQHHINKMESKYILLCMPKNKHNLFGQFYITYNVHKCIKNNKWPARPICSDASSLPHGLGKWVSHMLQPIAATQLSYFRDSFTLKNDISLFHLPLGALLFTSNAKAM